MAKKSSFEETLKKIQLAEPGAKLNPVALVRQNPNMAAMLSKFVQDPTMPKTRNQANKITAATVQRQAIQQPVRDLAHSIVETQTVMQMHPDLEIAAQILISCILAPEDLTTVEVNYSAKDSDLPSDIVSSLIDIVRRYMDEVHNIKAELPKILRAVLIDAGCYPIAVIPENSLDDLINHRVGAEDNSRKEANVGAIFNTGSKGILGSPVAAQPSLAGKRLSAGLEDVFSFKPKRSIHNDIPTEMTAIRGDVKLNLGIEVLDNPALLHVPELAAKIRTRAIRHNFGMEGWFNNMQEREEQMSNSAFARNTRERTFKSLRPDYTEIRPVLQKELASRKAIGCPLIIRLAPTAAIPVYQPGYPERHIGYFVPIDSEGNPIDITDPTQLQQDLSFRMGNSGANGLASYLTAEVKNNIDGWDYTNQRHIDYAAQIYAGMVEDDLVARLRNGLYGRKFSIANNLEIARLMLSRTLKNDHTTLLYIPVEMLSYFAFRFNKNGTGRSLMQDGHVVNAMRSVVTMANLFRSVRNSIARTKVTVEMDEDVEDPQSEFEFIKGELIRSRSSMPIYTSDPTEITNWLGAAGYEFEVQGNPGMPTTKIDFSDAASSTSMPDDKLDETLKRKSLGVLGINPELVDASSSSVEFAAQVWNNNALLNKRVIQIQDEFVPYFEEHNKRLLWNSETVLERMRVVVRDHISRVKKVKSIGELFSIDAETVTIKEVDAKGNRVETDTTMLDREIVDYVVERFVQDLLEAKLPRPNTSTLDSMTEYMEKYKAALDMKIEAIISSELLNTETGGEISGYIDTIKAMVRAHFMRAEMARIGFLPEVDNIVVQNDLGQPVINLQNELSEHSKGLIRVANSIINKIRPLKAASDDALTKAGDEVSGADSGTNDSNSGNNTDDGFGGGSELDELFGGGTDANGETPIDEGATTTEEEPPAEEEEAPAEEPPTEEEPPAEDTPT